MPDMPPMDMPPQGGMDEPMGGIPMDQGPMQPPMDGGNQFDTNFDAGVEADEEQDPKKFIQQLTGKLSQSLRKYNEQNGQPDVDLNKYVTGMITKQATEGLSQEDADEIIDKIKAGEDFEEDGMGEAPMQQDQGMQQPPMGGMGQQMPPMQQQPSNESYTKRGYKLDEIVNGVLNDINRDDEERGIFKKVQNKKTYRTKPYSSPNFE